MVSTAARLGLARALLVNTIIHMVLISIHPFAGRKFFRLVVAVLGLSTAFCFADPVFMARQYTASADPVRSAQSTRVLGTDQARVTLLGHTFEPAAGLTCAR
jgi:hypothetical protein